MSFSDHARCRRSRCDHGDLSSLLRAGTLLLTMLNRIYRGTPTVAFKGNQKARAASSGCTVQRCRPSSSGSLVHSGPFQLTVNQSNCMPFAATTEIGTNPPPGESQVLHPRLQDPPTPHNAIHQPGARHPVRVWTGVLESYMPACRRHVPALSFRALVVPRFGF